jgi:hypothetical protein
MNSLSELNTHGSQSVIVADSRKARIVFESQKTNLNSEISFASGVYTFRVTKDLYPFIIEEIINYQTCLPKLYITITPNSLTNTTLTRTLVAPVTSTNSNLEYLVANYQNHEDWNKNLEFTWNLPTNLTNIKLMFLKFKLTWLDEKTQTQKEIVWDVYDKDYYYATQFNSSFVPNFVATRLRLASSQLVSKFITGPVQGSANLTTSAVATCKGSLTYSISDSLVSYASMASAPSLLRRASSNIATKLITQVDPDYSKFKAEVRASTISEYDYNQHKFVTAYKRRVYWYVQTDPLQTWVIDYGDGSTATYTGSMSIYRSYANDGVYTITISDIDGKAIPLSIEKLATYYDDPAIIGDEEDDYRYNVALLKISSWGKPIGDWTNFCRYDHSLTNVPPYEPTTNLDNFFYEAQILNDNNLSYWFNTRSLTSAYSTFREANALRDVSLSNWNVSEVTNMSRMFYSAGNFNGSLANWNPGNVTNMSEMFWEAYSFNQPLNSWNVGKVTNMNNMFAYAYRFNQPLNSWNVSNVTDMSYMFVGCRDFNQNIDNWNVSKVRTMYYMFSGAISFNQPLNSWNVGSVNNMFNMFSSATSFNQPLNNWNVSKVTNMSSMFSGTSTMPHSFDQNISMWKVTQIPTKPNNFDFNTKPSWLESEKPKWGV